MAVYKKLLLSAGGGIVSSLQQAEQNPSLATLYIGLGGTGVDCIRNIKTQVYNRLRADNPDSLVKEYQHIRFVGVDTDNDSLSAGQNATVNPSGDTNTAKDDAVLGLDDTETLTIANAQVAAALKNPNAIKLRPELYWLNPQIDTIALSDKGAGGIRQAGRYMLIDKSAEYINRIKNELTKAMSGLNNPTVIINICSGMGGGTGSGCFLDACYLARHAVAEMGITAQIFGFFFLPEVNLSKIDPAHKAYKYVQTNGYAAMQELDYCMNIPRNGGGFTQVYQDSNRVEWGSAPVDMCFLIGATKGGNILANAYEYAMNVVAEYSMDILTRVIDDDNFGILSQLANFRQIVTQTNTEKAIGAELSYLILGAACASVPFKEINTYLASAVFSQFAATGKRVPNESEVAKFASDTLIKAIYRGSSGGNIWKALFSEIKEGIHFESYDDEDWKDVWDSATVSDGRPRANAEFVNFYTQNSADNKGIITKNAESMLSGTNTESLLNRIRRELNKFVCDMAYGPSFSNGILDAARANNLDNILSGLITQNEQNKKQEAAQNRYKECCNAIEDKNPGLFGSKKGKYEDIKAAYELLIQHEVELAAYDALDTVLKGLQEELKKQAAGYYGKLNTISETLVETFASNMRTLAGGKGHKNSYMKTLVSVSEIQSTLDDRVKELDMPNSYKLLMEEFLKNEAAWITMEEIKIASLINDFFVNNVFANFANRTLETFLREKYQTDNNEVLSNILYEQWMKKLTTDATPLFNFNPVVWDSTKSSPMAYLSVSNTCNALKSAADQMNKVDKKWAVKQTAHDDRIFVMCCTCALPLGSNNNIPVYERYYYGAVSEGRHYYESKQYGKEFGKAIQADWSNLPSVIPMSLSTDPQPLLENQINQVKALYKKAVEAGVLKSTSEETEVQQENGDMLMQMVTKNEIFAPNADSIKKLEELITKANTYEITSMADVDDGLDLVKKLNDDNVLGLVATYSLRSDGIQIDEDIIESIRMDYFGFAPVYQQKVREIMAQVSELREKAKAAAADLEKRIREVIERYTSIPQFCNALFYGVIKVEGNTIKYEKPGGLLGPKVYVLASSEAANAEYESVRLYQAYVNYNALDAAVRDDIKKAMNTLKDQGETAMIEPLRILSEGMLSAKKIAIALGAADAFRNAADIKNFYEEIVAKFEAIV